MRYSNTDCFVKSRKSLENVIPAPHQVRDKLQPVEDSDLSENPVNSITSGCRIKACPGLDPGSGITVLGLFTSKSTYEYNNDKRPEGSTIKL